MNSNRSLSRELSLISLGIVKDKGDSQLNQLQIEVGIKVMMVS